MQADAYFWGLIEQFRTIADNPLLYSNVEDLRKGYRRCVFRNRDSIYFRVDGEVVEIMAIIGQQDLNKWL